MPRNCRSIVIARTIQGCISLLVAAFLGGAVIASDKDKNADELGRIRAMQECLDGSHTGVMKPEYLPSNAAARLSSSGRAATSNYKAIDPNAYSYDGIRGTNAYCGIVIRGSISTSLIGKIRALAYEKGFVDSPPEYYTLGEGSEKKLNYWALRTGSGLEGILVSTHQDRHRDVVTEVDYHVTLIN